MRNDKDRLILPIPLNINRQRLYLPLELKPLKSCTFYFSSDPEFKRRNLKVVSKAYVRTSCGKTFYGTSGALKEMIESLNKTDQLERVI